MPAKPNERQYRILSAPLKVREEGDEKPKRFDTEFYVEGYATTFDDPYVLYHDPWTDTDYYEVISKSAFENTDMSDIVLQYNHTGRVLGRTGDTDTLIVEPDEHGLFVAADLSKSQAARDMYEEIKNGLITRMSWAFAVDADEFDKTTNTDTVTKVRKIYDVSAVSFPADPNTEISARNQLNGVIEQKRKEFALRKRKAAVARAKAVLAIANSGKD